MSGDRGANAFDTRTVQRCGDCDGTRSATSSSDTIPLSVPTITKIGVPYPSLQHAMDQLDDMPLSCQLSTDAKIAIAAMVLFMFLTLGFAAYLVYRRRSRHWDSLAPKSMSVGFHVFEDRTNRNRVVMILLPPARLSCRIELPANSTGLDAARTAQQHTEQNIV